MQRLELSIVEMVFTDNPESMAPDHKILKDFIQLHGPVHKNKNLKILFDICYKVGLGVAEKIDKYLQSIDLDMVDSTKIHDMYLDTINEVSNINLEQLDVLVYTGLSPEVCAPLLEYATSCGNYDYYSPNQCLN